MPQTVAIIMVSSGFAFVKPLNATEGGNVVFSHMHELQRFSGIGGEVDVVTQLICVPGSPFVPFDPGFPLSPCYPDDPLSPFDPG